MSGNISQSRICVEKILPKHYEEIRYIRGDHHSNHQKHKLSAAFYAKKLWKKGSKITLGFLDTGNQIVRTPSSSIKTGGKWRQIDPLQKQVENLSVQQAVKKIVKERIQPLVNLNLTWIDNAHQANVRISFDPDGGSWSLVGTDCLHERSKATMNFGWFDVCYNNA